jgi:sugar/nucleoside kinase (ribokinase family)
MDFLAEIPRLDLKAIRVVPERNNRVELRYESASRRCERLTGGVPPWEWPELEPHLRDCDALYVNFISGFEMSLDTARALGSGFCGPTYADLHSLFLGKDEQGHRVPRTLESWAAWLRCFDAVQMNSDEFELLGGADDPWRRADGALGPDLGLITVTLGSSGAAFATVPDLPADPMTWSERRRGEQNGRALHGTVTLAEEPHVGDPTGCGDVWGGVAFGRLLAGDALRAAMKEANRLAAAKVGHRGAKGLHRYLRESRVDEGTPSEVSL